jgi:regulator of sigma E protease
MLAWLAPVLVFGLVIFVHELGHFLAAKAMGVYAPRFSIGFGPAIWRRRRGETEYVLALLPLGGYVRMASRHDEAAAMLEGGSEEQSRLSPNDPGYDPEAMIPFGPKPVPEDRWFESKPLAARLLILVAGVTMNTILAFVVAIVLAAQFGRTIVDTRVVGAVRPLAGAPALAALQPGDTILQVNGAAVATWNDAMRAIAESHDRVRLTTSRGAVTVPLSPSVMGPDVAASLDYRVPAVIDSVFAGDPAQKAGLQPGDSVVSINGAPVDGFAELVSKVSASADSTLVFTIARHQKLLDLHVTPRRATVPDPVTGKAQVVGRIGAAPRDISRHESLGPVDAIVAGTQATWGMAGSIVGVVRDLVTRKVSVKQLGGPIAITRASVAAARTGLQNLFYLIALLSINVAVLNLLPVPILDGGQILLIVIETAKGSPFSLQTREYILRFGLLLIAVLFAIVMWNDTASLLGRFFQ